MSSQCYIMNVNKISNMNVEPKPPVNKEKVMSYEEKSVGSTAFFKCEACPYMALAEDDIKFHLFTFHPDLAKRNGLADNVQIPCPGCSSVFDAEETLRTHLRNHHKMGIKDVKKMIKSLVQIALKHAKLKKEDKISTPQVSTSIKGDLNEVKIPQVIEIVPDAVNVSNNLPKGVAYISVDELNKMSTPNFEKIDPKEIIQEASINIVYTNEVPTQYMSVADTGTTNTPCNIIRVSSVPPDLISSIKPRVTPVVDKPLIQMQTKDNRETLPNIGSKVTKSEVHDNTKNENEEEIGTQCGLGSCTTSLKSDEKLVYHRKCHQNGHLVCPECPDKYVCLNVETLHTHLWKMHNIDMELPTCEICGYKTFNKYRLYNIHMKCHSDFKRFICPICSKTFNKSSQLSKHKDCHKNLQCSYCCRPFTTQRRMKEHIAAIHEHIKSFQCSHCEYKASRKADLKIHLRSHTGEKPYACDQCSYRSADPHAMRRHKKIHTKDRLYQCKYCPYSSIQATAFASHMISVHPNINSGDLHRCPYCPYKSVNKDNYVSHLTKHADKEGIQLLIEMTKDKMSNKPTWTIPSKTEKNPEDTSIVTTEEEINARDSPKPVNEIPIEVYDCDSISESLSQNYCNSVTNNNQQPTFNEQVTDLSKDDNNSDCVISESLNDTLLDRQFSSQHPLQMTYENNPFKASVSLEQNLLQNSNVNSLAPNHSPIVSNVGIMSNFPIRLPPVPQLAVRNNIMLKPVDKISLPMTKVTGPIIKPTQILPVPSSNNSPVHISLDPEGVPRKKPKISVKSNLILKGPDQDNMFHSQQKMAFRRLENNERFGLGGPVTFNNLITTQFLQLQPGSSLNEPSANIMTYPQETILDDAATTPGDSEITNDPQIFAFNQQMSVNSMTMLPTSQKIQTNDPSYIKLEATIKQNTQSPSLERMCDANLINNPAIGREYKASPPLEDIHKNMNEIKNEVKSDAFYNIALNNTTTNPSIIDQYLVDNILGEQYSTHMDLSTVVLPEIADDQVIEIDDNSDDNKLLPRFDVNFPLESLYLMHNDFHFLENEVPLNSIANEVVVSEMNRIVTDVPIINQKDNVEGAVEAPNIDFPNFIQGKKDPMMNTSVRPTPNKINVKNIELMKN